MFSIRHFVRAPAYMGPYDGEDGQAKRPDVDEPVRSRQVVLIGGLGFCVFWGMHRETDSLKRRACCVGCDVLSGCTRCRCGSGLVHRPCHVLVCRRARALDVLRCPSEHSRKPRRPRPRHLPPPNALHGPLGRSRVVRRPYLRRGYRFDWWRSGTRVVDLISSPWSSSGQFARNYAMIIAHLVPLLRLTYSPLAIVPRSRSRCAWLRSMWFSQLPSVSPILTTSLVRASWLAARCIQKVAAECAVTPDAASSLLYTSGSPCCSSCHVSSSGLGIVSARRVSVCVTGSMADTH